MASAHLGDAVHLDLSPRPDLCGEKRLSGEGRLHYPLETYGVRLVKGGKFRRVHVEDGDQGAGRVEHRNHELASRAAVAGDVAWEGLHVRHDQGPALGRTGPDDAAAEGDAQAAK